MPFGMNRLKEKVPIAFSWILINMIYFGRETGSFGNNFQGGGGGFGLGTKQMKHLVERCCHSGL